MFEIHSLIFNFIDINTNTTVAEEIFQMSTKLSIVHNNISQDRICINQMKNKKYHTVWAIPKSNTKSQKEAISIALARGCSGSQKVGASKIARCHFQVPVLKVRSQFGSQLKCLQGANFFEPKQWMIACTTTSFMFSFMYKWSRFVCTNVNVCIVLLFFISISSSKTKRFIKFITIYCILWIIRDSARILRPLVTFAEQIFNARA